jgi:hypothetical protein
MAAGRSFLSVSRNYDIISINYPAPLCADLLLGHGAGPSHRGNELVSTSPAPIIIIIIILIIR